MVKFAAVQKDDLIYMKPLLLVGFCYFLYGDDNMTFVVSNVSKW
jgi:hypothetical protein